MKDTEAIDDLRYPVGSFQFDGDVSPATRERRIGEIAAAPARLREAVAGLHHLPDSHLNAYTRIKLALTEEEPTIKPYEEALWAELPDARIGPIEPSLALLDSLHQRWLLLLRRRMGWS